MKTLSDAFTYRYRSVTPRPPLSARHLMGRFDPERTGSLSTMLRKAGPFLPIRDAYGFTNSGATEGWPITAEDARTLREHYRTLVDQTAFVGIELLRQALKGWSVSVPGIGVTGLPGAAIDFVINEVTEDLRNGILELIVGSTPGAYGRCGGMAFSALDFFLTGWPVDPSPQHPASGDLRQYIWRRLLTSIDLNGGRFLEWATILHVLPVVSQAATAALGAAAGQVVGGPVGAAIGAAVAAQADAFGLGGPKALLGPTKDHWEGLKAKLDREVAWPIGLIYADSASPIDQHQALAIGYIDGETPSVEIWDNNDPRCARKLQLDFRGEELQVREWVGVPVKAGSPGFCSLASDKDKAKIESIKGIICEEYAYEAPPASLKLKSAAL